MKNNLKKDISILIIVKLKECFTQSFTSFINLSFLWLKLSFDTNFVYIDKINISMMILYFKIM